MTKIEKMIGAMLQVDRKTAGSDISAYSISGRQSLYLKLWILYIFLEILFIRMEPWSFKKF